MNPSVRKSTPSLVRLGVWTAALVVLCAGSLQAQQLDLPNPAGGDIQVTITAPKECFADQPSTFQVVVVNNGSEPSKAGLELRINYGTLNKPATAGRGRFGGGGFGPGGGFSGAGTTTPGNAVRETKLALPALAAKESRTFQFKLTPRRIGDFRVLAIVDGKMAGSASSQVRFDPNTSVADMLPAFNGSLTPRLPTSLADVAELSLESRPGTNLKLEESFEHVVHAMDRINYINGKKSDGHALALLEKRADMNGVPMAMGDACRLKPERAAQFSTQVTAIRSILGVNREGAVGLAGNLSKLATQDGAQKAEGTSAHIAALVQVFGPESAPIRLDIIKHLATIKHAEAGKAIAGMAVFAPEAEVRTAAIESLKDREEQEYVEVLVRGLNYPWPEVAGHAADAIVKLKKTSLLPKLVDLLEGPDPRAPQAAKDGKLMVREMVKVNHLRNCLLCHAPRSPDQDTGAAVRGGGFTPGTTPVLVAPAPLPNQPLTVSMGSGVAYYSDFPIPDVLVRFDVTYLRQDFSVMMTVKDHQPWPEVQRFDFLVRSRAISEKDADAYRTLLRPTAGALNPYQQAALVALKELTGRDAGPTGPAWRRVLDQIKSEG